MNRYTFEELTVGQTESYSVTVTEDMLAHFLAITGDCNPLHNDAEFAKKKGINLTLSDKFGDFDGGLILSENGVDKNFTFEVEVALLKEQTEAKTAKEIFG